MLDGAQHQPLVGKAVHLIDRASRSASGRTRRALRLTTTDGPARISRLLGGLYLCGSLLVILSLFLPHPDGSFELGLWATSAAAIAVGAASLVWAKHASAWSLHVTVALGTALICLCVYFAQVAAGVYSAMFAWVVLLAASFFSPRAVAAHVAWILIAWAGTLTLVSDPSGFSNATRWILGGLVLIVAAVVISEIVAARRTTEEQLRTEIKERERLETELEHLANHDPLTGVANRRRFEQELTRELARSRRHGTELCLVALDLDGLKQYNDAHGHTEGDRLLKLTTSKWIGDMRADDLLARMGGDEFLALLPSCGLAEAELVAHRLRSNVPLGRSCSLGVVCWDGRESGDELVQRADAEMYAWKRRGDPAAAPSG